MRELKFRYIWQHEETGRILSKVYTLDEIVNGKIYDDMSDNPFYKRYVFVNKSQFTGLHDENGVEIYEGDIVKEGDLVAVVEYHTEDVGSCGCCYTEFDGAGFAAFGHDKSNRLTGISLGEDCEVIGNVHQNPELVNT